MILTIKKPAMLLFTHVGKSEVLFIVEQKNEIL
jgi:hypothetical protein